MVRAVIVIALVSGCIGDEDDSRKLTATWHLTSLAGDTVACPAGFGSAELAVDYDSPFTACDTGSVTYTYGEGLLTDAYVEITSDDHATPLARSPSIRENGGFVDDEDMSIDTEILVDGGYFQFSWQLAHADLTEGQCGDDGVADIAIEARFVDTMIGTEVRFSCGDPRGRAALAPGRYLVTISARDAQHQIVGTPHSLGEQLILEPSKLKPVNDFRQITIAIP